MTVRASNIMQVTMDFGNDEQPLVKDVIDVYIYPEGRDNTDVYVSYCIAPMYPDVHKTYGDIHRKPVEVKIVPLIRQYVDDEVDKEVKEKYERAVKDAKLKYIKALRKESDAKSYEGKFGQFIARVKRSHICEVCGCHMTVSYGEKIVDGKEENASVLTGCKFSSAYPMDVNCDGCGYNYSIVQAFEVSYDRNEEAKQWKG